MGNRETAIRLVEGQEFLKTEDKRITLNQFFNNTWQEDQEIAFVTLAKAGIPDNYRQYLSDPNDPNFLTQQVVDVWGYLQRLLAKNKEKFNLSAVSEDFLGMVDTIEKFN